MIQSKKVINKCLKYLNPKSVLDLGCGECKFTKRFIDKDILVVGVDKKPTTISQSNFKFIQQDILDFEFQHRYDLIIAIGVLHFLRKNDAKSIIKKMQDNTLLGGFNFLICMSDEEEPMASRNPEDFYPNKKELSKLYSGWGILNNESCLSKKHGASNIQHKLIILLARKIK